jgi:hypothetical protein
MPEHDGHLPMVQNTRSFCAFTVLPFFLRHGSSGLRDGLRPAAPKDDEAEKVTQLAGR